MRKIPRYSIRMWSVHQRVVDKNTRVNNSVEAWHKVFENDARKHPTVNKIIQQFLLEEKLTRIQIEQIRSGDQFTRRKNHSSSFICQVTIFDQMCF